MSIIKKISVFLFFVMLFTAYGADPTSIDHVRSPVKNSMGAPKSFGSGLTRSKSYIDSSIQSYVAPGSSYLNKSYQTSYSQRGRYESDIYKRSSLLQRSSLDRRSDYYRLRDKYVPYMGSKSRVESQPDAARKPLVGMSSELAITSDKTEKPATKSYERLYDANSARLERDLSMQISRLRLEEQLDYSVEKRYLVEPDSSESKSGDESAIDKAKSPDKEQNDEEIQQNKKIDRELNLLPQDGTEVPKDSQRDLKAAGKKSEDEAAMDAVRDFVKVRSQARRLLGEHKTYEEYSKAKVDFYVTKAQAYVKAGKFSEADSSYNLALVYSGDDAGIFYNRSLVLLAYGDFMRSIYYLERAIKIDPAYASKKVDIAGLIGDEYESRLEDMKILYESINSPRMAVLMAYVYNQIGRVEEAGKLIKEAKPYIIDSGSVRAIQNAIEPATVK